MFIFIIDVIEKLSACDCFELGLNSSRIIEKVLSNEHPGIKLIQNTIMKLQSNSLYEKEIAIKRLECIIYTIDDDGYYTIENDKYNPLYERYWFVRVNEMTLADVLQDHMQLMATPHSSRARKLWKFVIKCITLWYKLEKIGLIETKTDTEMD